MEGPFFRCPMHLALLSGGRLPESHTAKAGGVKVISRGSITKTRIQETLANGLQRGRQAIIAFTRTK